MIWRLIKKNISIAQMLGYSLASVIGLSIVLCSLKFYFDAGSALNGDSAAGGEYIVIAKPASMLGSFIPGSGSKTISQEEITDISAQPWAKEVGAFSAANFGVTASLVMHGRSLHTQMFMESVPDEFIDELPSDWHIDPASTNASVPIIIPRDYLSLYNYGYAATQGLPQLTEEVVTRIPFNIYLNGNGRTERRTAHIAAFSDRLNTIAVPDTFLRWANQRFGEPATSPSRIIAKVDQSRQTELEEYLDSHGLETSAGAIDRGRARQIVDLAAAVLSSIGMAICALALFILILSTSLLMQKNKEKNRQLLLLGYSPARVAAPYIRLTVAANTAVLLIATAAMLLASRLWQAPLRALGISAGSGTLCSIGIGVAIMAVITLVAIKEIRKGTKMV